MAEKATEAFCDLITITDSVRAEGEGYYILGQPEASMEVISQFVNFLDINMLNDRNTLLMLNGHMKSDNKLTEVVDQFSDIAKKVSLLKKLEPGDRVQQELFTVHTPREIEKLVPIDMSVNTIEEGIAKSDEESAEKK